MSDKLRLEFDWLNLMAGNEIDHAFAASIGVSVGGDFLTRNDDLVGKTVRDQMRGCAWHLAAWFAANWWRLRWEPEAPLWWQDVDWRIAHSMASAGGGFVWPNAIFASDGDSIEIAMRAKSKGVLYEPIRYLNSVHARTTAAEFEQSVDQFMEGVLSRHEVLKVKDQSLTQLWKEILVERREPGTSERRKLEAIGGYDPDEAPDELLAMLLADSDHLGKHALEEVAAHARHATGEVLKPIRDLSGSQTPPQRGGFRASMPKLDGVRKVEGELPWQQATRLARLAREKWGLGRGPVSNQKLANLLGSTPSILTDESVVPTGMPLAFHAGTDGAYDVYFNRPRSTTRRFAVSRLIGDHLIFANNEKLRPATCAKTSRQKFQRAFAQEFLCPIDALMEIMQTEKPEEDDISEAASYFDVSPLMIRTTLVNNGKLEREILAWAT